MLNVGPGTVHSSNDSECSLAQAVRRLVQHEQQEQLQLEDGTHAFPQKLSLPHLRCQNSQKSRPESLHQRGGGAQDQMLSAALNLALRLHLQTHSRLHRPTSEVQPPVSTHHR